jgi:hypothetical protein
MLASALNFAIGFFGYPFEGQYQQLITIEHKGVSNQLVDKKLAKSPDFLLKSSTTLSLLMTREHLHFSSCVILHSSTVVLMRGSTRNLNVANGIPNVGQRYISRTQKIDSKSSCTGLN